MNDKINELLARFFLDDHHRMERFCAIFIALVLVLVSCYGAGWKAHIDNQKLALTNKALYSSKTFWSLTKETVQVVDLYRNDNFTKVFILLRIINPDTSAQPMQNLSTNANDYQILMTGSQGSKIQGNPTADIYMFADTGYIGLYFAEASGFSPALYDIVVRNNKMLKTDVETDENSDNSFDRFNQIRIFANFAGLDGTVANFLNKDNPTVEEIYTELLLKKSAESITSTLNQTLIDMNNEMARLNDITTSLSNYGINVPAYPASINGDYITTDASLTADNPTEFNFSMLNTLDSFISTRYNVTLDTDSDETATKYQADDKLYFVTDYVFPGGYQFDYQDLSLTDGIIDRLMADYPDMTFREFADNKSLEAAEYNAYTGLTFDDWYYNTGNPFVYDSEHTSPDDTAIYNAINRYETSVQKLYDLKKQYQTDYLAQLVQLEAQSKSVANIFSVRSDKETLIVY